MAKIIKRKDAHRSPAKHTCVKCKSLVEYNVSDVRQRDVLWPSGWVSCPNCGKRVAASAVWQ